MLSASSVCASRDARGNSRRSTGCSSFDKPAAMPLRRMTSITPDHRQIMPPTVRQNVTACCTPCAAAAPTAALCPVTAPKISAMHTMPTQTQVNAMKISPFPHLLAAPDAVC